MGYITVWHQWRLYLPLMVLVVWQSCSAAVAQNTVQVTARGIELVGQPLAFDGKNLVLMRRDGRISIVPTGSEAIKTISNQFKPYSGDTIRTQLQQEFGGKYQVSLTRNFVVVHPPGDYQDWAMPFELLYQRFRSYFTSRGFSIDHPSFPLVAIVLRKRSEFDKFLETYYTPEANMLGYYSQKSNRIVTYDPSSGRGAKSDWAFNETLIHEAVHQTAFNVGIHKRFGFTPKWVVEGLACMFEAKGVHNSQYFSEQRDRINQPRLAHLKYYLTRKPTPGFLAKLIEGDRWFETDPAAAYAYSWGLTFFMAESYPTEFYTFLRNDSQREEFRPYNSAQRMRAFTRVWGDDLHGFEKRFEDFILKLK